ncbi:MAG: DNA gyrase inhibitor YacG, partial [Planctomycetota bacterium]|nr:DNA gyrase inhibitor YacG [Planctomycetota bacterium]
EEPHGPFCSDRCRMADLGSWFAGDYSISREIEEDDLMDPDVG